MAFTYPPTGGFGATGGDTKTIQLITGAPAGWYSPKGYINFNNNYWDPQYVTMVPFAFDKAFAVTDWAVLAKNWGGADGNFSANGGILEAAIYNSDATTFVPTTLLADLDAQNIPNTPPGGGTVPCVKTLVSAVVLDANKVYWVALRTGISDGEGYVSGSGPELQQLINTGVGVTQSFPAGDNNLSWSNGEKAAIYDDANSFAGVGSWVASHSGGLYPFVSWVAADMVPVKQGPAVLLKGAID